MKTRRLSNHLRLLFVAAVLLPCALLALIAVRSIDREEAYIEKQFQGSLDAELTHVASLMRDEIGRMQAELDASAPAAPAAAPRAALEAWKRGSPLVGVPFLLSSDNRILWPTRDDFLADQDLAFLNWNREFITDRAAIPYYQNVVSLYKKEIAEPSSPSPLDRALIGQARTEEKPKDDVSGVQAQNKAVETLVPPAAQKPGVLAEKVQVVGGKPAESKPNLQSVGFQGQASQTRGAGGAPAPAAPSGRENKMKAATDALQANEAKEREAARRKSEAAPAAPTADKGAEAARNRLDEYQMEQRANVEFEQNAETRKRVYDAAAEKGQKAEPRTVTPQAVLSPQKTQTANRAESLFISEPRKFSEITAGREAGLIPRFIEEKLSLLYWKRADGGRIVGCVVEATELRSRILGRLPSVYSSARVLTVLDENGRPLATPPGGEARDWRRPLVAQEISEVLPRWEAAAYPTDPGTIAARAQTTRIILVILILAFLVSIVSGGTLILGTLRSEMALARQKTTFVTNVSHELKTPLTSIRMFAEMLREGRQPDPDKQHRYLGLMVAETERLTRLINNVLDFSRMEKGKKRYEIKTLDAAFLAEDVVESQRLRLEQAGFAVAFRNRAGRAPVAADEEALKQALINLLSNAEKYSPAAKSVEVEVDADPAGFRIDVLDRGIGVAPSESRKIFREFYRVDQSLAANARGSGLGLTIAQRIVRDLGGDILHIPRDGGGSVFRVVLPKAPQP